ncbi:Hypothetical protein NTJ_15234 [Nesidiocoris tenuis]|uniref:Uncharacterized protein n=1 Tax=Nesidiocoris tenuis TaxID=355587 RepID=A0ABN7BDG7_9HEMI|nr:Hypothetical protein NTJ_15234 [Nesidiocoris tenuis]
MLFDRIDCGLGINTDGILTAEGKKHAAAHVFTRFSLINENVTADDNGFIRSRKGEMDETKISAEGRH